MTSKEIRDKYIKFFTDKKHKQISPSKLVSDDASTLFTSSGMQPLVPYLLGKEHPEGKRLVNSQPCFRAEDIEEVGDNRHTTFFEMLGNWSLGDYFKKEQLSWFWEFLTKELNLPKEKLYVSVFEGNESVPEDKESLGVWKSLGIEDDHIYKYGVNKNWWSRSGIPEKMPAGEIGGPDSEVFYEFTSVEHDKKYGEKCHPNCDCGRFLEIGNSVFIQYQKQDDGTLKELDQKNVDFGGGLERLVAVVDNDPDVFHTDLFRKTIEAIVRKYAIADESNRKEYPAKGKLYSSSEEESSYRIETKSAVRIIADHIKAAVFLIKSGIIPSNKEQGYVLRRLIRRSVMKLNFLLEGSITDEESSHIPSFHEITDAVADIYGELYFDISSDKERIGGIIDDEVSKFKKTLKLGLKEFEKYITFGEVGKPETRKKILSPKDIYRLYETYGFPYELSKEEGEKRGIEIPTYEEFEMEANQHRELSRTASAGMFKGGLADHSETVTKYHTVTHLLHQVLRDVLGDSVFQKGSNITSERLRFDFSYDKKMTDEEIKRTEELLNKKIEEDLKVDHMIIPLAQAKDMNAIGLFDEKYASNVSLYGIGPKYSLDSDTKDKRERGGYYSLEFCGGPHVEHTGVIGKVKIIKEEAISSGIRRIRVVLA